MDVIDKDESTFVLLGQSLADGRLPYTETYDIKPPLGYVFFALIQLLVPHSLTFVRFAGNARGCRIGVSRLPGLPSAQLHDAGLAERCPDRRRH